MDSSDPYTEALLIALARTGIGVGSLLLPRVAGRVLFRRRTGSQTAVALRLFGGREVALGVGTALAARRRTPAVRGWVEAGVLADASDVVALFADRRTVRPPLRIGGIVSALAASTWGLRLADRLAD